MSACFFLNTAYNQNQSESATYHGRKKPIKRWHVMTKLMALENQRKRYFGEENPRWIRINSNNNTSHLCCCHILHRWVAVSVQWKDDGWTVNGHLMIVSCCPPGWARRRLQTPTQLNHHNKQRSMITSTNTTTAGTSTTSTTTTTLQMLMITW